MEYGHDDVEGLSVGQMSKLAGVSADTLRYYERAGLIARVTRNSDNQRRYQQSDVEWIRFLLHLRQTGMPLARMRTYAVLREKGDGTLNARLSMLADHQRQVRDQVRQLQAHDDAIDAQIQVFAQMLASGEGSGASLSDAPPD